MHYQFICRRGFFHRKKSVIICRNKPETDKRVKNSAEECEKINETKFYCTFAIFDFSCAVAVGWFLPYG